MLVSMLRQASATVLSSWVRVLLDAVEAEGHDVASLLEQSDFDPEALRDPNARHSIYDVARLWHSAALRVGDPAFGLRVPKYIRHTTFHALSSAVFASATVGEALGRAVRYRRVITDSGLLKLDRHAGIASLCMIPSMAHSGRAEAFRDSILALNFQLLRALIGPRFKLRKVTLYRAASTDLTPYAKLLGVPVERSSHDTLCFDAAWLDLELPSKNSELIHYSEAAVRDYLARLDSGSIVDRARDAIGECQSGELSPELVAKKLGMSLRTLQRSLRECGSSYEKLLRDGRRELACNYLRDGRHSVTQTAYALGYESSSAFARAFKRWTGQLPSEYQHNLAKRGLSVEERR
jgi:AraC-like DNA-binding protein